MSNCPAASTKCFKCGRTGHFGSVCLSKLLDTAHAAEVEDESNCVVDIAGNDFDYAYTARQTSSAKGFYLTLKVNGRDCRGLLDTGATGTIITQDVAAPSRACDRALKAYSGGELHALGMADIQVATSDASTTCSCCVVPAGQTVLFGQDIFRTLNLLDYVVYGVTFSV